MFTTAKVPCFVNGFAGHGDDAEAKELKLTMHISSIPQPLAAEISPFLADRLFRKNEEGEWVAAEELTKSAFSGINVPMQNITFHALPDGLDMIDDGVLVLGCAISNLRSSRPAVEARLEFDVVVPMDKHTMRLIEKYYKATCYLTMEKVQREMELEAKDEGETQSLQDAADGKSAGAGEEKPKRRGRKPKVEEVPA